MYLRNLFGFLNFFWTILRVKTLIPDIIFFKIEYIKDSSEIALSKPYKTIRTCFYLKYHRLISMWVFVALNLE